MLASCRASYATISVGERLHSAFWSTLARRVKQATFGVIATTCIAGYAVGWQRSMRWTLPPTRLQFVSTKDFSRRSHWPVERTEPAQTATARQAIVTWVKLVIGFAHGRAGKKWARLNTK